MLKGLYIDTFCPSWYSFVLKIILNSIGTVDEWSHGYRLISNLMDSLCIVNTYTSQHSELNL